jgi:hypothetical protein
MEISNVSPEFPCGEKLILFIHPLASKGKNVFLPQKRGQSFYRLCKIQGPYPTNYPRSLPESYSIQLSKSHHMRKREAFDRKAKGTLLGEGASVCSGQHSRFWNPLGLSGAGIFK